MGFSGRARSVESLTVNYGGNLNLRQSEYLAQSQGEKDDLSRVSQIRWKGDLYCDSEKVNIECCF